MLSCQEYNHSRSLSFFFPPEMIFSRSFFILFLFSSHIIFVFHGSTFPPQVQKEYWFFDVFVLFLPLAPDGVVSERVLISWWRPEISRSHPQSRTRVSLTSSFFDFVSFVISFRLFQLTFSRSCAASASRALHSSFFLFFLRQSVFYAQFFLF